MFCHWKTIVKTQGNIELVEDKVELRRLSNIVATFTNYNKTHPYIYNTIILNRVQNGLNTPKQEYFCCT